MAVDRACSLNKVVGTGEYFRKEGRGGGFGKVDDANSYIGYVNITMVIEIERMREEMGLREKGFQVGERKGGRPKSEMETSSAMKDMISSTEPLFQAVWNAARRCSISSWSG